MQPGGAGKRFTSPMSPTYAHASKLAVPCQAPYDVSSPRTTFVPAAAAPQEQSAAALLMGSARSHAVARSTSAHQPERLPSADVGNLAPSTLVRVAGACSGHAAAPPGTYAGAAATIPNSIPSASPGQLMSAPVTAPLGAPVACSRMGSLSLPNQSPSGSSHAVSTAPPTQCNSRPLQRRPSFEAPCFAGLSTVSSGTVYNATSGAGGASCSATAAAAAQAAVGRAHAAAWAAATAQAQQLVAAAQAANNVPRQGHDTAASQLLQARQRMAASCSGSLQILPATPMPPQSATGSMKVPPAQQATPGPSPGSTSLAFSSPAQPAASAPLSPPTMQPQSAAQLRSRRSYGSVQVPPFREPRGGSVEVRPIRRSEPHETGCVATNGLGRARRRTTSPPLNIHPSSPPPVGRCGGVPPAQQQHSQVQIAFHSPHQQPSHLMPSTAPQLQPKAPSNYDLAAGDASVPSSIDRLGCSVPPHFINSGVADGSSPSSPLPLARGMSGDAMVLGDYDATLREEVRRNVAEAFQWQVSEVVAQLQGEPADCMNAGEAKSNGGYEENNARSELVASLSKHTSRTVQEELRSLRAEVDANQASFRNELHAIRATLADMPMQGHEAISAELQAMRSTMLNVAREMSISAIQEERLELLHQIHELRGRVASVARGQEQCQGDIEEHRLHLQKQQQQQEQQAQQQLQQQNQQQSQQASADRSQEISEAMASILTAARDECKAALQQERAVIGEQMVELKQAILVEARELYFATLAEERTRRLKQEQQALQELEQRVEGEHRAREAEAGQLRATLNSMQDAFVGFRSTAAQAAQAAEEHRVAAYQELTSIRNELASVRNEKAASTARAPVPLTSPSEVVELRSTTTELRIALTALLDEPAARNVRERRSSLPDEVARLRAALSQALASRPFAAALAEQPHAPMSGRSVQFIGRGIDGSAGSPPNGDFRRELQAESESRASAVAALRKSLYEGLAQAGRQAEDVRSALLEEVSTRVKELQGEVEKERVERGQQLSETRAILDSVWKQASSRERNAFSPGLARDALAGSSGSESRYYFKFHDRPGEPETYKECVGDREDINTLYEMVQEALGESVRFENELRAERQERQREQAAAQKKQESLQRRLDELLPSDSARRSGRKSTIG